MEEVIYEDTEELKEAIPEYTELSFSKEKKDKPDDVINQITKDGLDKWNDIMLVRMYDWKTRMCG